MNKSNLTIPIKYYTTYIDKIPDIPILDAIERFGPNMFDQYIPQMIEKADYAYAEGKWTIKQKLQHIIDTERVFAHRAFVLSRHDDAILASFDQDPYVVFANVSHKTIEELMYEWQIARISTRLIFKSLSDDDLLFLGNVAGQRLNALAMGFALCGHAQHHLEILTDKYLITAP
jgi:hypothetical protein